MKPNNFIYLRCLDADHFCRVWLEFLTPFHKLTVREKDVAARLLVQYFRFKDSVQDQEVLYELLWSKKSSKDIMDSLKMSPAHFQMIKAKLKNAGFIVDDKINRRFIPDMIPGSSRFALQIMFDWSTAANPIHNAEKEG